MQRCPSTGWTRRRRTLSSQGSSSWSHADSPGEFDIAEFFINSKGKRFWMTAKPPTKWAEIETYEYINEDGTPVYDDY